MPTETDIRSATQAPAARRTLFLRLLLAAAILTVFGRTLANDFVDWDDSQLIYANPNISQPTTDSLLRQWNPRDPDGQAMYDPLVFSAWWGLAHTPRLAKENLLGTTLNPLPFHAANLLVHWLTACLALAVLRRIGVPDWPAAAGALLFAIHPLQTEAVAWATGMKDLLSGLFEMAAILAYVRAVQTQGKLRRNRYLAATVFCLAALLAKPSAAALPLIVAAVDLIHFRRPWREVAMWTAPWLAMAVAAIVIAGRIQPASDIQSVGWSNRPLIAGDSVAFYLSKLAMPVRLTFEYARTPAAVLFDPALHYAGYWTWILPVGLGLIVWRIGQSTLSLAAMIFLLGVLPVLGLTPFEFQYHSTVADRYVYMSMLGAAMATGWVLTMYGSRPAWAIACAALLVLGSLSFVQAGRWKNTETLYEYGLGLHVATPMHWLVLGQYKDKESQAAQMDSQPSLQRKYLDEAIEEYDRALQMDPEFGQVYRNLTVDLIRSGRIDEAIDVTKRRIDIQPRLPKVVRDKPAMLHATLGMLYFRAQRYEEAVGEFERSLHMEPNDLVAQTLQQARRHLPASRPATKASK